ncbi:hypothetical protein P154DRAFT_454204 [Amniculicola lignicola CBS 123094]|uniref:separase n=1 Tax=Amniculicola lignicola CBS 123094 TaxID=1392246 RepID=A0A6A5X3D2_9PLEO|nr:hypothetical protein P154DRAFT_454204 [Amniculicola lignicola CBS 123094]
MAPAKAPTRTRMETIRADLRSVSTCTPATVAELQRLLTGLPDEPVQKENVRVKSSQLVSLRTTARKTKASATTKTTSEVATTTPTALTLREKYIFATEIVNAALRSLSGALKHTPAAQPTAAPTPRAPANGDLRRPAKPRAAPPQYAHAPLRERSASQLGSSPKKPSLGPSPSNASSAATGHEPGLVETAECARTAFAYLRTPEALKTAGKDSPALQLENGLLAFIGKLVAHGLDVLAIKELRILKRRLDRFIGTRNVAQSPNAEKESLASLLDFGSLDRSSSAVPLVVTHQMYTLRMIGKTRRSRVIEEAWEHLNLSNPSSPAALMLDVAKLPGNEAKTTRQLESLAQTILALCLSGSSLGNDTTDKGQLPPSPSPDVVFHLQHLAFTIRQTWWSLAKHQADEEKELIMPFAKCLMIFARKSQLPAAETYLIARSSYEQLLGQSGDPLAIQRSYPSSAAPLMKCLSSLAQSAGMTKEALRWLTGSGHSPSSTKSAAGRASDTIRVTTLSIDAALKDASPADLEGIVSTTIDALAGDLVGSSEELDSLFRETNSLRRLATRAMLPNSTSTPSAVMTPANRYQLVRIIAASIHLCTRFASTDPTGDTNCANENQFLLRCEQVFKSSKSILDSVLICSKSVIDTEDHWPTLDGLIQDTVAIITQCERNSRSPNATTDSPRMSFVRLSNAYWSMFMQLNLLDSNSSSSVVAMKRSINLLIPRPQIERKSGHLAMKLEKFAETLKSQGEIVASRGAYAQCIGHHIECGLLQEAVRLAANLPLIDVLDKSQAPAVLGRVLKAYHQSFIASATDFSDEQGFYDDDTLADPERGVLLEWQLMQYVNTLSRNRDWGSSLHTPTQRIAQNLCDVYDPAVFPVRNLRMVVIFLQLSQEYPGIISQRLLQQAASSPTKQAQIQHQDLGLLAYEKHLENIVRIKSELRENSPSITALQQSVAVWQPIVEAASSWGDICAKIDNPEHWIQVVQGLVNFLAAKGEDYICLHVLHLLVRILELKGDPDLSSLTSVLSSLGLQFLRLGYSGKAGLVFAKAETLVRQERISTEAKLQWHIGYAEYLLKIGTPAKCEAILRVAQGIAHADAGFSRLAKSTKPLAGMIRYNRVLADACHVSSMLALSTGHHQTSAKYARQSLALNRRIWVALEGKMALRKTALPEGDGTNDLASSKTAFDPLSSVRDDKGRPLVKSMTHDSLNSADLWPLVPCLYRAMMQQSLVYEYEGLVQDATLIADQAEKVAAATQARFLLMDNLSLQAEYWAQSGKCAKAQSALEQFHVTTTDKHLSMVKYYSSIAKVHHSSGNFVEELATYDTLEILLTGLSSPSFVSTLNKPLPDVDTLEQQVSVMTLNCPTSTERKSARGTKGLKPTTKPLPKTDRKGAPTRTQKYSSVSEECLPVLKITADIARRKALALLLQDNISAATHLLDHAKALDKSLENNIQHLWASYKTSLSTTMSELAKDFRFNSLAESTIAFPSISQKDPRSSDGAMTKKPLATASTARVTKVAKNKASAKDAFVETLRQAHEHLSEAHRLCTRTGSTVSLQQTSSALSQITVLLSVLSIADPRGSVHPLYAAYMSELPKMYALRLAQESLDVEAESLSGDENSKWPDGSATDPGTVTSVSDFQDKFVDIIPQSWTAISLSLNETLDELYLTRFDAGHTPFILRIPLARHNSHDMDEEQFSFEDGKREFEEIIELTDFSTHSAKDMTTKDARTQWWDEREALDEKLGGLLINMENIWFGGFKGIFSLHPRQTALLARFRKSFDNILARHLPSRQGKASPKRPTLDARVLELFVGLGDATDEKLDLDEPLEDLVYFVVDILQFNGEHNAYDEIDFDSIVLETYDALRAYHNAAKNVAANKTHMILILDKNLHMFPWESMPCLQSLPISRLPSLAALRERILASKPAQGGQDLQPGHYISASNGGTSMLNPSADLSHTSKTLKPRLDQMQGAWNNIIDRAPTEKEFKGALRENELVLYFGHGSGATYVRSRSVRRLYPGRQAEDNTKPGCATTFLFGCSSVHLSDNGVYEPSGMLASYLMAGAPAVLGMLWDVTDKDCDRLAVKTGELWGLWPETKDDCESKIAAAAVTRKGKGKVAQLVADVEGARGAKTPKRGRKREQVAGDTVQIGSKESGWRRGVGLDEAVKEARDACVLRYLNGAAAVVYGIPVYLE